MIPSLSTGAIGIRDLDLRAQIALAGQTGWAGLVVDARQVANLGVPATRQALAAAGVQAASWGLPFAWNREESVHTAGIRDLPLLAATMAELGCTRVTTWMPPGSNERPYGENLAWHVARFRPIAEILRASGCALGIEYIGPKAFRTQFAHPFECDLDGYRRVREAIGVAGIGLLLDAWHLWHSGSMADIRRLTAEEIVAVHVNDAPAGTTPRDELVDTVRALPGETGRIPLDDFVRELDRLGYAGPVTPEPFSARLNDLAGRDAAAASREALSATQAMLDRARR